MSKDRKLNAGKPVADPDLLPEFQIGKFTIREGDRCDAILPLKKQFTTGLTFIGHDIRQGKLVVKDKKGFRRYVSLDGIRRREQTKKGTKIA